MKTKLNSIFCVFFLIISQYCYSQVDVVYSNLIWSDEFNTNGAVDPIKWHHQTQLPAGGSWYNGEVQHYTNQLVNSFVNTGFLNIVAKKEPFTDQGITKQYTSARLNSKFAFKYGRVDVRAKIPVDSGTWPAIWLLGKNINEDGGFFDPNFGTTNWPACGEIDIMEHGIFPSEPINHIQSALHTPSSFGNTVNIGGTIASDLVNNYHVYSMNWSPFQISFLLDDVVFYTYNPTFKNPSNWPFNLDQYLLLNIAMGGIAGTINPNYTQSSMLIDYVRVYQNTATDTQTPTNFTAILGTVNNNSVELLLNANDNSGNIGYSVAYNAGTTAFAGISGTQKSIILSNLTANTNYTFTVTATDLSGNVAANNPIILNASTTNTAVVNTECAGVSTEVSEGTFSTGYKYAFQTIGNDVKITFEMLDTDKTGVVAFLRKQNPFTETPMTNVSGKIFTKTIQSQTIGSTIIYAVKFAYAGGLVVTRYFSYVVGNTCSLSEIKLEKSAFYFQNPAKDFLNIVSDSKLDKVEIYNSYGSKVFSTISETNKIDISSFAKGIYIVAVFSGNEKSTKKLILE